MSDPVLDIDVAGWVERVKHDPVAYRQRQAIEITLNAIAMTAPFNEKLYLKGGILMGLVYNSPRQTSDIDFTANLDVAMDIDTKIRLLLNGAFSRAAAMLGYADLVVKIHSIKPKPKSSNFETAQFPALKMKIGYALRGSRQEGALLKCKSPDVIDVDISFNEAMRAIRILRLTGGQALRAYSLIDLIAEKYRAMLQQVVRNRNRRQDVYDLHLLIQDEVIDADCRAQVLETFLEKSHSRHIKPDRDSLDNPEIKRRCGAQWDTFELELGSVPDFEMCFTRVRNFYRQLPWGGVIGAAAPAAKAVANAASDQPAARA